MTALPLLLLVTPLVDQFFVALGPGAILVPMIVLALEMSALSLQLETVLHGFNKAAAS